MAKLILSLEGSVIREIPLDKERIMIGRKASNDIQIENLAVSGEHACIVTILKDSFLEDLGSTNGTLVNGNPVRKHILQNNDVIEIGKYRLKYLEPAAAQKAGPKSVEDFEKTMVLHGPASARSRALGVPGGPMGPGDTQNNRPAAGARPGPFGAAATAQAKPGEAAPMAAIQILTGGSAGRELDLVKNLTTLGKPGVQVAVITRRPQGYFIAHVEGANFPIVNGRKLDAQATRLSDHDVIELAGVKMEFFIKK